MSDPTTVNGPATVVNRVIAAGTASIVAFAESLCIAQAPWLAWPGIKQLWQGVFKWISDKFIIAAQNGATFAIIDHQTQSEVKGLSAALAALAVAEKSGDPVAIKKAIQDYANAHSLLVHDDGSAPATP